MRSFYLIIWGFVTATVLQSCAGIAVLSSYSIMNKSEDAVVDSEWFSTKSEEFEVFYNINTASFTISNLSDKSMVVDLGETYVMLDNREPYRLYENSVTTMTKSATSGGIVNMGAVANVLGVGGAAGTLANGINVGKASTDGVSVQYIQERYVSLPAKTRKTFSYEKAGVYPKTFRNINESLDVEIGPDKSDCKREFIISYFFDGNEKLSQRRDLIYLSHLSSMYPANKKERKSYKAKLSTMNSRSTQGEFLAPQDLRPVLWGIWAGLTYVLLVLAIP